MTRQPVEIAISVKDKEDMMKRFLVFITLLVLLPASIFAQHGTSNIYGTVVLRDGPAVPGATITLVGDVIGRKTTTTSNEGNFRFLYLPPGNYELKFERKGFKTVIRKNIRTYVGKNISLKIRTQTTTIREEIEVTGKAGVVDTRKATVGVNFSNEMLRSLPNARNPWTILNLVPGIMMDREDVGGNESGQQSMYAGPGVTMRETAWYMDGANISNSAEAGGTPAYLDVNMYEELQVTLGSNDITAQTGGVQLNFVTRRAGNRIGGGFHLYVEDEAWEMDAAIPPDISQTNPNWGLPGIYRMYQYGVNLGGPIVDDRAWFFGSYAVQDIHSRTIVGDEDTTWLVSGYFKMNLQLGNTSADFMVTYNEKKKWGRPLFSRVQHNDGSLWDQDGPGWLYYGSLQQVVGNLMLNFKVTAQAGRWGVDPRGADIGSSGHNEGNESLYYSYPETLLLNSSIHTQSDTKTANLSLSGNYWAEGLLGGDHEIRFGVDYNSQTASSQTLYANQRLAVIFSALDPDLYREVWLVPDSVTDAGYTRYSIYLQDTSTFARLTVNLGLRYDNEGNRLNPHSLKAFTWYEPGSPYHDLTPAATASQLGEMTIPGISSPVRWRTLSPRFSLSYDITGDGKNVLKLTAARYGSQVGLDLAWKMHPGLRENIYFWVDHNSDNVPNYTEIFWDIGALSSNTRKVDYANNLANFKYADDFNTPLLDEFTLSFEKELMEDLAISIIAIYKRRHNLAAWNNPRGILPTGSQYADANGIETRENWFKVGDFTHPDGQTVPYYGRHEEPIGWYYENYRKRFQRYLGLQMIITKKFSNNSMLDASFTFSDWREFLDLEEEFDLQYINNFDYFNGGVVAQRGGSGFRDIFANSRWMFKFSGLYQLPWGINATAVFRAREGYVIPYNSPVQVAQGGVGWVDMYEPDKKFGDDRLPPFWMLNLGLEKTIKISDTAAATIFVNGYNITNNRTVLMKNPILGSSVDKVQLVSNPGIFQFGFRLTF
jgi:hypothetical protein